MQDDLLPVLCETCGIKYAEQGRPECFHCRVSSVGFGFIGGGGYGREAWQRTTTEFLNENIGFDHADKIRSDQVVRVDS